jgi:hypothetical protein
VVVYILSLIAQERIKQLKPNLECLCLEGRKRFRESVLILSPVSVISAAVHDGWTATKAKLFVSTKRLTEEML